MTTVMLDAPKAGIHSRTAGFADAGVAASYGRSIDFDLHFGNLMQKDVREMRHRSSCDQGMANNTKNALFAAKNVHGTA
jgi:hypothetical protein